MAGALVGYCRCAGRSPHGADSLDDNTVPPLDPETCYRALSARDPRFDGLFFVGVQTTGVYCRPVCPARLPRADRCTFHRSAAAAESAGFRACFRCRPELAPGLADVDARARLARAASARIQAGALDRGSLADLAAALKVTPRHLRRVVKVELGATPSALASSRRLAIAKRLLQDTALPVTEVADLAGFGSVRRFQSVFSERFGRPPSKVRRGRASSTLTLRLDHRPPLDWPALLAFIAARATPGVEWVDGDAWVREVHLDGHRGRVRAVHDGRRVRVSVPVELGPVLPELIRRLRRLFDLDARPGAVADVLGEDPLLADSVAASPGLRVPGAFDGFELAVRTILGQQVSVKGATTLCGRLHSAIGGLQPARLSAAGVDAVQAVGLPRRRAETLVELSRVWPGLDENADPEAMLGRLSAIRGVGPWTTAYLAMRWLRWPDAFPAGDLVLRRALGGLTEAGARAASERWRPWRAYAAMHLWRMG